MASSRSTAVTDAQLTKALTREAESYGLDEWEDFPEGVNLFVGKRAESGLREILMALEESSLGSFTHPSLELTEDASGKPVGVLHLRDYRSGGLITPSEVLELLPNDARFEGWQGVLLVARRFMDIIDSVPRTI